MSEGVDVGVLDIGGFERTGEGIEQGVDAEKLAGPCRNDKLR